MKLFMSEPAEKVPEVHSRTEWIRFGFFFAFGVLLLYIAAYVGVKILAAVLSVITPFAIGLMLALLLDPIVDRLERRKIHRTVAVSIIFAVVLGAIVLIAVYGIPAIISQGTALAAKGPGYFQNFVSDFLRHHKSLRTYGLPHDYNGLAGEVKTQATTFLERSTGQLSNLVLNSVQTIFDLVVSLIVGFYLLVDIDRIRSRFYYFLPEKYRQKTADIGQDIGQVFSDYLRGLVTVCVLYGLTTTLVLYILAYLPKFGHSGLAQYALLIGASAGVLYAIPYLGALTTAVVTFVVGFATGDFGFGLLAVLSTLVVNQTFDNVIAPKVVGGGVGLNPVLAIFSLTLGGCLFGFWGLLFSVPIAASIQVILFRLFPKMTKPTPVSFLRAHGVPPGHGASSKIMSDAPTAMKEQMEKDRAAKSEEIKKEVAAENTESPDAGGEARSVD